MHLCEWKFKISINTSYSSPVSLLCGVPQGSMLGPLLFLLCVNDLSQAVASDSLLYADVTCIVFQHKSEIEIEKKLIRDFSSIKCVWLVCWQQIKYTLKQDITKSILFGTKHKRRNAKSLNIVYNGIEIKQHAKVKYLGCILDESLSGESMALNVINKMNSRLTIQVSTSTKSFF